MRNTNVPAVLAAGLLLAIVPAIPGAAAQPGCTSATDSCPVEISVDEEGFVAVSQLNFTLGDWHMLSISNEDEKEVGGEFGQTHTVTLSGYGVQVTVEPLAVEEVVVEFSKLGCFELKDMPTGRTVKIRVVEADSIDYEQGLAPDADPCIQTVSPNPQDGNGGTGGSATDAASKGMPGPQLGVLLLALTALAAVVGPRRR